MVAGCYFQRPLLFSKISARDRNIAITIKHCYSEYYVDIKNIK